jgi:heterodisulfide reductase subunit A
MAQFDKTFPTLDCSACILTPKMVSVGTHPNITLLTWSQVEKVEGILSNFSDHTEEGRKINENSARLRHCQEVPQEGH